MARHYVSNDWSNPRGYLPVSVIRVRVAKAIDEGDSFRQMCIRGGFIDKTTNRPDISWFKRSVGIIPYNDGNGGYRLREWTGYPLAKRLCKALNIDPVDIGL